MFERDHCNRGIERELAKCNNKLKDFTHVFK